ncbi:MAG: 30S ribosomal protein S18 [Proteobacteria bacterium]|nr:30S ribosomal protein S18 [Pseudomonadota bacterium]
MKKGFQREKTVYLKRKTCRFCADQNLQISYKDYSMLRYFVSERGKIIPRRISGNCAKHQREITKAIKRARIISILPFSAGTV